jgi:hypothetical protein
MTATESSPDEPEPLKEPLHELLLGRPRSPSEMAPRPCAQSAQVDSGFEEIAATARHCLRKAEAARWAAERQRRIREGCGWTDEDSPADPAMIEWAERLTDAFYWANAQSFPRSPCIAVLDHVGGCFETVAAGLHFANSEPHRHGGLERALKLLAEAQSALRRSLNHLHAPDDPDQLAVYEWLRSTAARNRVFLKRFMRADDLADPAGWPNLLARIETAAGRLPETERQRALLDELRCGLNALTERGQSSVLDWQPVIQCVEEILSAGLPPSNRELRDLLLPFLDDLPVQSDLPRGFQLVARELDRYLAMRQATAGPAQRAAPSDEVQAASRLLAGRSLALIGGIRRPQAQKLLIVTLGLKDLIWIETREHQSFKRFEPTIARGDVALVLLAIRWASHGFADVKQFCDQYAKPLVRLPGGYSPNQVAAQVLSQAGDHLGAAGSTSS